MTTRPPRGPPPAPPAPRPPPWEGGPPGGEGGGGEGVAAARGALPRNGARPTAVVADEAVLSARDRVQGQGDRTGGAGGHVAAVTALHEGRHPAAVEEKDHLLSR